jgi:hypothetical protein
MEFSFSLRDLKGSDKAFCFVGIYGNSATLHASMMTFYLMVFYTSK